MKKVAVVFAIVAVCIVAWAMVVAFREEIAADNTYSDYDSAEPEIKYYTAEEIKARKARAIIDSATFKELEEAMESNRLSREYEKRRELEKALDTLGRMR